MVIYYCGAGWLPLTGYLRGSIGSISQSALLWFSFEMSLSVHLQSSVQYSSRLVAFFFFCAFMSCAQINQSSNTTPWFCSAPVENAFHLSQTNGWDGMVWACEGDFEEQQDAMGNRV